MSGMNFDRTYDRRRAAIAQLRDASPVSIYDAIESFLETANFDYVIGASTEWMTRTSR